MDDPNTYAAPQSSLLDTPTSGPFEVHEPVMASVKQGLRWLPEGFGYFKASPGPWVLTCIVGFVILMVLSALPFVNMFISLTTYIWIGGIMMGCKAQYDGDPFDVKFLFQGFQEKLGQLLALGAVMFVANMFCLLLAFGSLFLQVLGMGGGIEQIMADNGPAVFAVPLLVYCALLIPLMMATWFAPALIALCEVPVFKAMSMSFMGCLKNMIPLFFYSLVMFVAMILASVPLFLGWLVLTPMMYASVFAAFKDIYISEKA